MKVRNRLESIKEAAEDYKRIQFDKPELIKEVFERNERFHRSSFEDNQKKKNNA